MGYRCGLKTHTHEYFLSSSHLCLLCCQRLCLITAYSQPYSQTVVGKQRQMLSSILPALNFFHLPPMSFSLTRSPGRTTCFIRIFVCLSQLPHRCRLARRLSVWKSSFPTGCAEVIPALARSLQGHAENQPTSETFERDAMLEIGYWLHGLLPPQCSHPVICQ